MKLKSSGITAGRTIGNYCGCSHASSAWASCFVAAALCLPLLAGERIVSRRLVTNYVAVNADGPLDPRWHHQVITSRESIVRGHDGTLTTNITVLRTNVVPMNPPVRLGPLPPQPKYQKRTGEKPGVPKYVYDHHGTFGYGEDARLTNLIIEPHP